MFSKLIDSQDITSHLIFVKSCPTVSFCFYDKNESQILQSLFYALLNNPINKKQTIPPKKKIGGGSSVGVTTIKDSMVFFLNK